VVAEKVQEGGKEGGGRAATPRAAFACCFAAGFLSMLDLLLFNGELYGAYDGLVAWTRDEGTLVEVVLLVALMLAALWRPALIRPRAFTLATVGLGAVGCALCAGGVAGGAGAAVVAGVALLAPLSVWGLVLWLLACSSLGMRRMLCCVAGSGVAAVPVAFAVNAAAPYGVLAVASLACEAGVAVVSLPVTGPFFARLAACEVPAHEAVVRPQAFLPFTHAMYGCIFAFGAAYGFALRCENITGSGAMLAATLAALAGVTVYAWRAHGRPRMDALFSAAFFVTAAGFMLLLVDDVAAAPAAAALLVGGYTCVELLTWFALCSAAARNTVAAIPAICWGTAVSYLGICCGVGLWLAPGALPAGAGANLDLVRRATVALLLAALILGLLLTRRTFSFDAAVEGIAPDEPKVVVRYVDVDAFEGRCARVAGRFGLTEREADVLRLLARGNNTARVQDELAIGRNTVKYHVKNIYAKLGVHSQQEMIDLVAEA
jgi:DNA-binding CsgD family transcriptional regulator